DHAGRIRAEVGLGQSEATDHLTFGHLRQPSGALLLRAVGVDRVHGQRTLDRGERTQPRVATLQLLHGEAVGGGVHSGAAVLLRQRGAEQAHVRHLTNHLGGEERLLVGVFHQRQVAVLHPVTDVVADLALVFVQKRIDLVEINAGEARHAGSLQSDREGVEAQAETKLGQYRGASESAQFRAAWGRYRSWVEAFWTRAMVARVDSPSVWA